MRKCENCRYYDPTNEPGISIPGGYCHRYPPASHAIEIVQTIQPTQNNEKAHEQRVWKWIHTNPWVAYLKVCGEWKRRRLFGQRVG